MDAGKRTKEETGERIEETSNKIGGDFVVNKNAPYVKHRLDLVHAVLEKQKGIYKNAVENGRQICIKVKVGDTTKTFNNGKSFSTTPLDACKRTFKKFCKAAVISKVTYSKRDDFPL